MINAMPVIRVEMANDYDGENGFWKLFTAGGQWVLPLRAVAYFSGLHPGELSLEDLRVEARPGDRSKLICVYSSASEVPQELGGLLDGLRAMASRAAAPGVHDKIVDGHVVAIATYPDGRAEVEGVTHVPDVSYPHKEHRQADHRAYRRLKTALADIMADANGMLTQMVGGRAHDLSASDADRFDTKAAVIRTSLAELAILNQVREWNEADRAGQALPADVDTISMVSGSEQFAHQAQAAIEGAALFGRTTQVISAGLQVARVLPGSHQATEETP